MNNVRCKTCHYSLVNLTEQRCPECGTAFNPDDPNSYVILSPEAGTAFFVRMVRKEWFWLFIGAMPVIAALLRGGNAFRRPTVWIGLAIMVVACSATIFMAWQKRRTEQRDMQ